jgi:hypothetical protein
VCDVCNLFYYLHIQYIKDLCCVYIYIKDFMIIIITACCIAAVIYVVMYVIYVIYLAVSNCC